MRVRQVEKELTEAEEGRREVEAKMRKEKGRASAVERELGELKVSFRPYLLGSGMPIDKVFLSVRTPWLKLKTKRKLPPAREKMPNFKLPKRKRKSPN